MNSTTPQSTRSPKKSKIIVWTLLAAIVVAAIVGYVLAQGNAKTAATGATATEGQVVRENSRVLSQAPNEKAVLVEFLDFECESCGAFYPVIEELRGEYAENITFVQRYFPLPGHLNSMNAALAVESAALQGAYEPMYKKMFETQAQWGESADNKSALFRTYAEDLGLDLAAYDASVADPATQDRIKLDIADGKALGVSGTPTFFLEGKMLTVQSLEQFVAAIEEAAAN
ncbi:MULTISPECIES: DsbA family protein [Micrococcaceae]|uniref:Periplasmic thiol:disulfide interchange protein DsbA n=2 Tax=Micrococcaceae TaxID=1268 RepID=A0A1R4FM97_9MICC|nr:MULTISPECIES: thioredoxin domain-containing protein [Micrococcaceae]MDR7358930.1 protein-disulfide isomerase [Paeniglutamicibacter sulfureus]PCC25347.1 disulfide bond formation protein DsbA [Glutamicibacter sp. BW78]SJM57160.1 Periplasmic thiol:disulfide interchange protein DsbA [Arthrobacter rhombi]